MNKGLSTLAGKLALTCGKALAFASAAVITAKHIDYGTNVEQLPTISE